MTPAGSVNTGALRLAIEDVIATYGKRYPKGPAYLKRLAVLEEENRQRRAADRVAAAMAAGKLTPAQQSWASRLCLSDESLFDEYVGTAPVVVQTGRLEAPAASNGPAAAG